MAKSDTYQPLRSMADVTVCVSLQLDRLGVRSKGVALFEIQSHPESDGSARYSRERRLASRRRYRPHNSEPVYLMHSWHIRTVRNRVKARRMAVNRAISSHA